MFLSTVAQERNLRALARGSNAIQLAVLVLFFLFCTSSASCGAQQQRSLCRDGFGIFSSKFQTGVTVTVGASKNGAFASHACEASLRWRKSAMHVVEGAYLVDIDVLGADLGLGFPVVAFQIKNAEHDRLMTYQIYSLQEPPRLLRTLTGGDSYDAQDMNLEDRSEIWTDDAGAVDNFENLPLSSFNFLPTVVLAFEKRKLTDISSEFQPYYDRQIAQVKSQLDARTLTEFKNTDGELSSVPPQLLAELHEILRTKIAVLEIVWAYLYSGREQQAWNALAEMWPPADISRIRDAIQNARAQGILHEVDEVSKPDVTVRWKRHAMVYAAPAEPDKNLDAFGNSISRALQKGMITNGGEDAEGAGSPAGSRPIAIYLDVQVRDQSQLEVPHSEIPLNLVIDAAGKVQSAKLVNNADRGPIGDNVIGSSASWNFIPAFSAGRPVACRIQMSVSPEQ